MERSIVTARRRAHIAIARRRRRSAAARGGRLPPPRNPRPNKTDPGPKCGKRHRGRICVKLLNDSSLPTTAAQDDPGVSHAQPFRTGRDGPHSPRRRFGGRNDRDHTRRRYLPDLWGRVRRQLSAALRRSRALRFAPQVGATILRYSNAIPHRQQPGWFNIFYFVTASARTLSLSCLMLRRTIATTAGRKVLRCR